MSTAAAQFIGSIPAYYDRDLGPYLFAGYAADMAVRIAKDDPERVLEIAAGTGILTQQLRAKLRPSTKIVATDLNAPMLEIARPKFAGTGGPELLTADATALPFEDDSFDAVVCQFGVMFFPDKPRSYREVARVLAPGGRYTFSVWDTFDVNPFAKITHETIGGFFASDPPQFYKTPFGYHDTDVIRSALQESGFDDISVDVVTQLVDVSDATQFAQGLVFGNAIVAEIREKNRERPEEVATALAEALRTAFVDTGGRMPLQAFVIGARKL